MPLLFLQMLLTIATTVTMTRATPFRVVTDIPGRMPSNAYSAEVRDSDSGAWVSGFVLQTIARNASKGKDMSGGAGGCGYQADISST